MASYTDISHEAAHSILGLYGIRDLAQLSPQKTGISNSNYRVTLKSGDELILKISNDKMASEINEEQKILHFLQTRGYPFSLAPYKTLNGAFVYEWESLTGVLYPFVKGEVPQVQETNLFEIGKALGQLHLCTIEEPAPSFIRSHRSVGFDFQDIQMFTEQADCPSYFNMAFKKIFDQKAIAKMASLELPQGLIHGDLYYDNTLFRDGELIAVLDFEQAGMGEYLFDLGVSISGSCLKNGLLDKTLIEAYMKGYQSERPLTDSEAEVLDFYIIIGLFSIARWRIRRFVEKNIDPTKKENYKELLERAINYYELK
ncbi:MAG: phosphotransferase [Bacteriovoracaceae bacterium]|nr:phosphotransferase [Bacteriovoracaceae bacterium]